MIDDLQLRRASGRDGSSCRLSTAALSALDSGPGRHSVIRYFIARVSPASGPGGVFRLRTA